MSQFERPDADISVNGWINQVSGSVLWSAIDEVVADDTDFIQSPNDPVNVACEVRLSDVVDPVSSTGHILRFRIGKNTTSGKQIDLNVALMQGGTTIASFNRVGIGTTNTVVTTLSAAQADLITDYTNLSVRFTANVSGNGATRSARVYWVEFEVPDVAGPVTLQPAFASFAGPDPYSPSVGLGAVVLDLTPTPPIPSAAALYAPSIQSLIAVETGSFQARVSHVRAGASVRGAVGEVFLTAPFIASGQATYAPTVVAGAVPTLVPPFITTGEALYQPALAQVQGLPAIASGEVTYPPSLVYVPIPLTAPFIGTGEAVYAPAVGLQPYALTMPFIGTAEATFAMVLTLQPYAMVPPAIPTGEVTYPPSLGLPGLGLVPPIIPTGEVTFAPSLGLAAFGLTMPNISTGEQVFAPALTQIQGLPIIGTGEVTFAPALIQNLVAPFIASGQATYAPTLVTVALGLYPPVIASGEQTFAPSLGLPAVTLTMPAIGSGQATFAPAVVQGLVVPLIASAAAAYPPTLVQAVIVAYIASGAIPYAPSLASAIIAIVVTGPLRSEVIVAGRTSTEPASARGSGVFPSRTSSTLVP